MPCKSNSPGPAYVLPPQTGYEHHDYTKNRSPAFSFGLRTDGSSRKGTPGPHKVENCDRYGPYSNQGWTLKPRTNPISPFGVPGPGTYVPVLPPMGPSFSLGVRVDRSFKSQTPSAAEYYPQIQRHGGFTINGRVEGIKRWTAPTPGAPPVIDAYKPRAPSFSLGPRVFTGSYATPSPGPIYYPKRCVCKEPRHSYSFGVKHSDCSPPMITYDDNH